MTDWLLRVLVSLLGRTLRWRVEDPARILSHPLHRPVIFAFWHNRILLMPHLFKRHWNKRQRDKVAVLVSASKDGEKLARVLEKFDLICVRGSSSRRGSGAMRELAQLMEEGYDVGITPDGPRGPRFQVAPGVVRLSQLAGAPIVPVSYNLGWKITLKSWDAFMIPLPFARATLRVARPLAVPAGADDRLREDKRLELENVLKSLSAV